MAANVTAAPLPPGFIAAANSSDALFGLCRWTSEDPVCYGTVIPIFLLLLLLVLALARQFWITPQASALQSVIQPKDSPLLPNSFRYFEPSELNQIIGGVSDMALKTFLPRIGLEELVEPSAALGIANVKDLLRANRLALRDIGIGPKEARLFSRALERRVRLREKMQEVFLSTSSASRNRQRAPTLTQRSREAVARNLRQRRAAAAAAAGGGGGSSAGGGGSNAGDSAAANGDGAASRIGDSFGFGQSIETPRSMPLDGSSSPRVFAFGRRGSAMPTPLDAAAPRTPRALPGQRRASAAVPPLELATPRGRDPHLGFAAFTTSRASDAAQSEPGTTPKLPPVAPPLGGVAAASSTPRGRDTAPPRPPTPQTSTGQGTASNGSDGPTPPPPPPPPQ